MSFESWFPTFPLNRGSQGSGREGTSDFMGKILVSCFKCEWCVGKSVCERVFLLVSGDFVYPFFSNVL